MLKKFRISNAAPGMFLGISNNGVGSIVSFDDDVDAVKKAIDFGWIIPSAVDDAPAAEAPAEKAKGKKGGKKAADPDPADETKDAE